MDRETKRERERERERKIGRERERGREASKLVISNCIFQAFYRSISYEKSISSIEN